MTLSKYTKVCMYKVKVLLFCIQNNMNKVLYAQSFQGKKFCINFESTQSLDELKLWKGKALR